MMKPFICSALLVTVTTFLLVACTSLKLAFEPATPVMPVMKPTSVFKETVFEALRDELRSCKDNQGVQAVIVSARMDGNDLVLTSKIMSAKSNIYPMAEGEGFSEAELKGIEGNYMCASMQPHDSSLGTKRVLSQ